ncbi:hypothetical protein D3C80_1402740 [compost metagenome]
MAVIGAFELKDFAASGIAAGQTNGAHGSFCTGINHPHDINRRHTFYDQFGHLRLQQRRRAEACPFYRSLLQRFNHLRMGMSHNERAPGADIVDKAVAVDIINTRADPVIHIHRCQADRFERPHRAVHPAGNILLSFFKSVPGSLFPAR